MPRSSADSEMFDPLLYDSTSSINVTVTPQAQESLGKTEAAPTKATGFLGGTFLLMNAILGSGILGQSYAVMHSGIVLYAILLILMGGFALYGIILLLKCCELAGVTSYEEVGFAAYGKPGKVVASIIILMQNFGAMIGYMVVLGDVLPKLICTLDGSPASCSSWVRPVIMLAVVVIVVFPLTIPKSIGFLGGSSGFSVSMILFFAVAVVIRSIGVSDDCPFTGRLPASLVKDREAMAEGTCELEWFSISADTSFVLPTLAFSFVCHTALLPIYTELKKRSVGRMVGVAVSSIFSCFIMYFVAGLFGYLAFRGYVVSDLMVSFEAYEPKDIFLIIVRLGVCLGVALTIPLINFPARKAIKLLTFGRVEVSWFWHVLIGVGVLTVVTVVAIAVPQLKNVLGAAGATSSVGLMFILPSVFYLKLDKGPLTGHRLCATIFAYTGAVIGSVCLGGIVARWFV